VHGFVEPETLDIEDKAEASLAVQPYQTSFPMPKSCEVNERLFHFEAAPQDHFL
jgi:hypothetical protein